MTIEEAKQFIQLEADWDWEKFRREAAKDILAGLCASIKSSSLNVNLPAYAIELTDELIKQLREDEK